MNQRLVLSLAGLSAVLSASADIAQQVKADFKDYGERPFVHYAVPPMGEVQRLPDTYPSDGVAGGTVRIHAAKEDYEPGAFEVWGVKDLGKVKFELGEFKQVSGSRFQVSGEGAVFPKEKLDLKVVKTWYKNKNAWFSYFPDTGFKLCADMLVNDEDLIRVDTEKQANYARVFNADGTTHEEWINPLREMDNPVSRWASWNTRPVFQNMQPGFRDAKTLQPVNLPKEEFRAFYLTAHVTKDIPAGHYKGSIILTQPQTSNLKPQALGSIPVEIVVRDFVLPRPKCYRDPAKDFPVCFYTYIDVNEIADLNGGDRELAFRQFEPIFRNQVAHGQDVHFLRSVVTGGESLKTIEIMKKAGMRTDKLVAFGYTPTGKGTEDRKALGARMVRDMRRRFGHDEIFIGMGDEPSMAGIPNMVRDLADYQSVGVKFLLAGSWCVNTVGGFLWDWANISQRPEGNELLRRWNDSDADAVAWYANHHVGTENPALNRRQNGLAGWLAGYTALCNYAHHLGPYNDDSLYYRPMIYAYGTGDGVLDSVQWEGFREGVDDVRYATLLCDLARKAEATGRMPDRQLGRKARHFLAMFDAQRDDLGSCRAEMTRYIEALLAVVKPIPDAPLKVAQQDHSVDAAFAAAAKPYVDELKKAKAPHEIMNAQRKLSAFYDREGRTEELCDVYEAKGSWDAAAQTADRLCDIPRARRNREKALRDARGTLSQRRTTFRTLALEDAAYLKEPSAKALFTDDPKPAAAVNETWGYFGGPTCVGTMRDASYPAVAWLYDVTAELADKASLTNLPYKAALRFFEAKLMLRQADGARAVVARALRNGKLKPEEAYTLRLAERMLLDGVKKPLLLGTRQGDVTAAAKAFADEHAKGLKAEQLVAALEQSGTWANMLRDEEMLRGLIDARAALYKPAPTKRYTVRYTPKSVLTTPDWSALGVELEDAAFDRKFGGEIEMLVTDVTTGARAVGQSGEKLQPTRMNVVADDWGLHFLFVTPDPKAREVELGLAAGGSFEGYIAPGKNEPYACFCLEDAKELSFFNTMYDTVGHRELDAKNHALVRYATEFTDDAIVTRVSLAWENYVERIPRMGSVWDFENMRWDRSGGNSWNGVKVIHGRSTWGELVFDLPEEARAKIMRRLTLKAYQGFVLEKKGAGRHEGCIQHWALPVVGDAAFHDQALKDWSDDLLARGKDLNAATDAETLRKLEDDGTLSAWYNVKELVQRRRAAWLNGDLATPK